MRRVWKLTDAERQEHVETLALLARLVVLAARSPVRRLFFVLSA